MPRRWVAIAFSLWVLAFVLLSIVAARADVPAQRAVAGDEIAAGRYDAARAILAPVVLAHPNDAVALYMLAVADARIGDSDDALAYLRRAQAADPSLSFAIPSQFDALEGSLVAAPSYAIPAPAVATVVPSVMDRWWVAATAALFGAWVAAYVVAIFVFLGWIKPRKVRFMEVF
jgi:tetratricopeptide (TPR) repeat protein